MLRRATLLLLANTWTVVHASALQAPAEHAPFARFAVSRSEPSEAPPDDDDPWRLSTELGAPAWLTFDAEQRTRYQRLGEDFRANQSGSNEQVMLRTLLRAIVRQEQFSLVTELQDSRSLGASDGEFVNTAVVNPVELLQAHVALTFDDVIDATD